MKLRNLFPVVAAFFLAFVPAQFPLSAQVNGVFREVYTGIAGSAVTDLTSAAAFPNSPSITNIITDAFEAPVDFSDNYGQRLRALVIPPQTGNYVFWVASDDGSELYLSSDESPAKKVLIASVASWTASREWTKEANQQSASIALTAGQRYYIEALQKEGNGGDNLAVRWQLPDSTIEEPIPAIRLLAYLGAPTTPPVITQNPASQSVVEGNPATFSVQVANADPLSYQWLRNGVKIPGALASSYTLTAASLSDSAVGFRCILTNSLGSVTSAVATLTVTPDVTPPTVVRVLNIGTTTIQVTFSEPVETASATVASNFSLNNGVSVSSASFGGDTRTILLTTTAMSYGTSYLLSIHGVRDRAATPNAISPTTQVSFTATEFSPIDIGSPSPAGSCITVAGGTDVSAGGTDIGGTADSMQFCYQVKVGDFDIATRVDGLTLADAWTKAGLMLRESLTPTSRFAAVLATPSLAGCYFVSRDPVASAAISSGNFPANFPSQWIRVKRAGSVVTGYASFDGENWVVLGSATISFPSSVYFGYAVASHASGVAATASFRDLRSVTGGTIGTFTLPTEPLGPCSRKTGLVISEIFYKPATRLDARNLEFVEVYNSNPFFEDLSGYRISGDVEFTFPSGTTLPGGGFLVVAAVPADVQAVYGIGNVTGPYVGSLKRSGTVRLRSDSDAILLEVPYSNGSPWPVGADGTGHSLVLARPSYGEGYPQAWAISDSVGGSPGRGEAYRPSPLRQVVINEFLAHTDANTPLVDAVELYNHSNVAVDLSGCILTDDPSTNRFVIPGGTTIPPRGFVSFDETQLGFSLSASGGLILLINPGRTRVLDAVDYSGQANGVSYGRVPDGGKELYPLISRTFGAANSKILVRDVVINEIMYDPISGDSNDAYVELFNKGSAPVNLTGWKFTSGISYSFPSNTILATNAYLVVAKNLTNLLAHYPALNVNNTFGDYGGKLSKSGDRIALSMPEKVIKTNTLGQFVTNSIHVVADEVTYGTGGRWGQWSAGGGSSLELRDPNSDHRLADNWADSDETTKGQWTTVEATGVLDNGAGPIDFVQIGILQAGECLVDNIELRPGTTGANVISNPDFTGGITGWTPQGDHVRSSLEAAGGVGGGACLHLRATDQMWTGANSVVGTLSSTTLAAGQTATLRFQARWLRGWPEPLLRIHGNYLEATARLNIPNNLGTPGQANSRRVGNAGPAIVEPTHTPSVPLAGQAVVVSVRVSDLTGIASVALNYRIDPATSYSTVAMVDNGTGGDLVAGDGIYSGTIPGQSVGTMVAFTILAKDSQGATTLFPLDLKDNGPTREALVYFGDTMLTSAFGSYRLWISQANVTRWGSLPDLSNELIDGTWVYGPRIIYNMAGHFAGSPYHQQFDTPTGSACHYNLAMPDDDRFLGATSFNKIHAPGNGPFDDDSIQREQTAYWVARQLKLPWNYRRYVNMFVNGVRRVNGSGSGMMEDTQVPNGDVVDEHFSNDSNGDLFKFQPWFEFDINGGGNNNYSWCMLNNYTTTGGARKLARYRWNYQIRKIENSANRYTNVFNLVDAANLPANSPQMIQALNAQADMEEWMRTFASVHSVGDWDHFGSQNAQNMYGYKPENGRWNLMIWDHNIVLGNSGSWGPGANLFSYTGGDVGMDHIYNTPEYTRAMWRAYKEIATGAYDPAKVGPVLDAKFEAFKASGITVAAPTAIKSWIASARSSMLSDIASVGGNSAFAATAPANFSTNANYITVTGTAPVEAARLRINGVAYNVTWTGVSTWSLRLALSAGANPIVIEAEDLQGKLINGLLAGFTVTYTGPSETLTGRVMINEIMYNPLAPAASYVELYNSSTINAFDLTGYRLDGADFVFPGGSIITPGGFLVVAKDAAAFGVAYGANIPLAGVMNGSLDNTGETLKLVKPGVAATPDAVIDEVTYDAVAPWPTAANGFGPSLQLIDPAQDNRRVMNWAAVSTNAPTGPTQPQWKQVVLTGVASSSTFYIYLQSAGDVYLDDLVLVEGSAPGVGANLFANGDFESALSGPWTIGSDGNNSGSVLSTTTKHSGNASLHLVASAGGSTRNSSIWQTTATTLAATTYTLSFWYLENEAGGTLTVRSSGRWVDSNIDIAPSVVQVSSAMYTPGAANSTLLASPAFPLIWLNEVEPVNTTGITDHLGHRHSWVEVYNSGSTVMNLSGYYLANSFTNLTQWPFPSANLNPGQYAVVFLDGNPAESTGSEWHASFSIPALSGSVALSRVSGGATNVIDYLKYSNVNTDRSYGAYPDATPNKRIKFYYPTPGGANSNSYPNGPIFLNEWMASNTGTLADPADGKFDDWFELFNAGPVAVDLSGYTLCNNSNTPSQFVIPTGYSIPAGGYLLVWADKDPTQNTPDHSDLHVNFNLSKAGEFIGLYAPNGTNVDAVTFGAQTNDVSQGRFPDGNAAPYFAMTNATPRSPNLLATAGNLAPTLSFISNKAVNEGALLTFVASAADPDAGQTLTFSLDPGAPSTASINPASGLFSWTPGEAEGPSVVSVTLRVTDNGSPALSASQTVQITVAEVNAAPLLGGVTDHTLNEGQVLSFTATASDPDQPANTLTFSLDPGAPAGAGIDPNTGAFLWTPNATQGGATYTLTIRVKDNGTPVLSSAETFNVTVTEVNTPPTLGTVNSTNVNEGTPLSMTLTASDTDAPAQTLTFTLEPGAPAGMTLNATSGALTWTPTEAQGPSTNVVTVKVTDSGTPSLSATKSFTVVVNEVNTAPSFGTINSTNVNEGTLLSMTLTASDTDAPAQTLTFTLEPGAPAGMTLNATSGALTWTPTEAQGPSTNVVTVKVTDSGTPSLSATKSFTVVVNEVNTAPSFGTINPTNVNEGTLLSMTLTGSDDDLPAQTLTFTLEPGAPEGMTLNATTGALTWTPTEAQGPSTNVVRVKVADSGTPSLSATKSFTVVVNEVNSSPSFSTINSTNVNEGTLLSMTIAASDTDVPAQTLSFTLEPGAPAGMTLNASSGALTWTPTEAQGPSTNVVTVKVTDSGTPSLSATRSFTVVVNEVNTAPSLGGVGNKSVKGGTTLSFRLAGSDADLPTNSLTFTMDAGAPSGATLTADGLFTWTPAVALGGTTANVTVRVKDNGIPSLSASETFQISVNQANSSPVLDPLPAKSVNEGEVLSFNVTATDSDLPAQKLSYTLEPGAPSGVSLSAAGAFSWTPTEAQGPGTYTITVKVADDGTPLLSDTKSFVVTVNEVNSAPVLASVADQRTHPGALMRFKLTASDVDLPTNILTYSIESGAVPGASLDPQSGQFVWTPPSDAPASTNLVVFKVTDDAAIHASDTKTVRLIVGDPLKILTIQKGAGETLSLTWAACDGRTYRVQSSDPIAPASWTDLPGDVAATGATATKTVSLVAGVQRFYRILLLDTP